jgi:tetratricopeptide (TPR) repeat protein
MNRILSHCPSIDLCLSGPKMVKTECTAQPEHDLLAQAVTAVKAGQPGQAYRILAQLIQQEPENEQAWLRLALLSSPRQARSCLRHVLRINPQNRQAVSMLRRLDALPASLLPQKENPSSLRPSQRHLLRRWLGIWLLIAAMVIVLGGFVAQAWVNKGYDSVPVVLLPQPTPTVRPTATVTCTPTPSNAQRIAGQVPELQVFWDERNWKAAIQLLNNMYLLDSEYPGLRAAKCETYLHWAHDLVEQGDIENAYYVYGQASSLCEDPSVAQSQSELALQYLSGKGKHDKGYEREAITRLRAVYDQDPGYADIRSLLFEALLEQSQKQLTQEDIAQAEQACQDALALVPDSQKALALLEQIAKASTPPVSTDKHIEVNLTQQRMYVWQGDTLLYKWLCSSGQPGRNTASGRFKILDKIPEAWASTWSLRMPYWMGIYYAGSLENGIHALPILSNGQILWAGLLGSPASYGCIILSTENARTLYEWAEIGTPVWIHY